MSGHNGLAALVDELAAMPMQSQRAILRALSAEERDALTALAGSGRSMPDHAPGEVAPFSPWLAARIDAIRNASSLDFAASRITPAARQALLRSADAAAATVTRAPERAAQGKSLIDTFGDKLAARMGRP